MKVFSSLLVAVATLLSNAAAQEYTGSVCVKSLSVKAGRQATITTSFLISEVPNNVTEVLYGITVEPLVSPLSSKNHTAKNKTSKFAGDVDVTLRKTRISPNTWRPKIFANGTGTGTSFLPMPLNGLVLSKQYKVTSKIRIGKGIPSGTYVPFQIFVDLVGGDFITREEGQVYVR
ncbi:hypothetical protein NGA_0434301 [Nannochloropsis gaditana CCMP526]|uniref:uncharacterized protein n=1 Tax=Nannochloropsis gaditana (strain CCMP526) TaxID=1093141 RepID=UPI00029F74AD|nr:hypothetical protein NGA_0434301 [Nannochloropsis gaditana CCMP526]EKU22388.1 hypothetical protein NGA_0434301 [Nannochloropsis gaditana CCMP526]|eukprot:XP_005853972.1 hypothetical protein NGA_0434301 [Nannochloropsis gaditana CCMP526]